MIWYGNWKWHHNSINRLKMTLNGINKQFLNLSQNVCVEPIKSDLILMKGTLWRGNKVVTFILMLVSFLMNAYFLCLSSLILKLLTASSIFICSSSNWKSSLPTATFVEKSEKSPIFPVCLARPRYLFLQRTLHLQL